VLLPDYIYTVKIRGFKIAILLLAIALSGILWTQLYWVRKAMEMRQDQFENSTRIALKSVVNRFMLRATANKEDLDHLCAPGCTTDTLTLYRLVNPRLLDSLLQAELADFASGHSYSYGIYRKGSGQLLLRSENADRKALLRSPHAVSLSCFFSTDPLFLAVTFHNETGLVFRDTIRWMLLSLAFLMAALAGFIYILQRWRRQKKLSEIKSDFINNMTHEFRTPIATISLASEMLQKKEIQSDRNRVSKYAGIIHNENARLQGQVERILQISVIDKGEFRIRKKAFDIHDVLKGLTHAFAVTISKRGGTLNACLGAKQSVIHADRIHFTNILSNLLDNAVKYSPEAPRIILHTSNTPEGVLISVQDNGIGINRENHENIFRNLYRVPTGDLHDVKGFGLGLYYVKRMTEAHGGYVKVESEAGKGSKFSVFFPFGSASESEE